MNRASIASLAGVAVALAAASALDDPPLRRGVIAGALLAAGVGLGGSAFQVHVARRAPRRAFAASTAHFGLCLAAVLAGALVLRYVPALAQATDYRGFLVSFGCIGFLLLVLGSLDVAAVLKEGHRTKRLTS